MAYLQGEEEAKVLLLSMTVLRSFTLATAAPGNL